MSADYDSSSSGSDAEQPSDAPWLVTGTGRDPTDPLIIWNRDPTKESSEMIAGIEKICKQACVLMKSTLVVVRPHEDVPFVDSETNNPVEVKNHVTVYMGNSKGKKFKYKLEGFLFYTADESTKIPIQLADPGDTGAIPSANPELYEYGTTLLHRRAIQLWDMHKQKQGKGEATKPPR